MLGPLVVGGFCLGTDHLDEIPGTGARDSKLLTPEERERAFEALAQLGELFAVFLSPRVIDQHVRHEALNQLEAKAFAHLWGRSRATTLYADACDTNPERFALTIRAAAGPIGRVIARHHADATLPIVGAGSVVAKVLRDRYIARLAERLGTDLGSGYPSDPRTIEYLRQRLRKGAPIPIHIRKTWATVERVKPSPTVQTLDGFRP